MNTLDAVTIIILSIILIEASYLVFGNSRRVRQQKDSRQVLVDTSVLIDGRIITVAQSGFIGGTLVIPRSVVGELQFLADNADHEKRARARHGLDVIKQLQDIDQVSVTIFQDGSKAEEGVDERLLKLAKKYGWSICTIDYNLNKVAVVEGIQILNINELAQKLRMAYLPGEKILLELVQKGQDGHQAVGYLVDGTMVVVEQASKLIGKKVEVEFIRALQTAAGKMMFARLVDNKQTGAEKPEKINPNVQSSPKPSQKVNKQARKHYKRPTQQSRESDVISLIEKQ